MQILSLKKALDFINDESNIFKNTKLKIPKKINISKTKNLPDSREVLQVLLNLKALIEAIKIFDKRNTDQKN